MLKKLWDKFTDPRIIITKGTEEVRQRTCPECKTVVEKHCDLQDFGITLITYYYIYKCPKCGTKWRVRKL